MPVAVTNSYTMRSYGLLRANESRKYFCIPSRLVRLFRSVPPLRPIKMLVQIVVQLRAYSLMYRSSSSSRSTSWRFLSGSRLARNSRNSSTVGMRPITSRNRPATPFAIGRRFGRLQPVIGPAVLDLLVDQLDLRKTVVLGIAQRTRARAAREQSAVRNNSSNARQTRNATEQHVCISVIEQPALSIPLATVTCSLAPAGAATRAT